MASSGLNMGNNTYVDKSKGYKGKFGLSADIQRKLDAKYDYELEAVVQQWIEETLSMEFTDSFAATLKNGFVMCKLLRKLHPKSIKKKSYKNTKQPFPARQNIQLFIRGCKKAGMREHDICCVADLYEAKNMMAVISCLDALRRGAVGTRRAPVKKNQTLTMGYNAVEFESERHKHAGGMLGAQVARANNQDAVAAISSAIRRASRASADRKNSVSAALASASDTKVDASGYVTHKGYKGKYGMSAAIQKKLDDKYDYELEAVVQQWIEELLGIEFPASFIESLKDGVILCNVINAMHPKSIKKKKIHMGTQKFKQMENINHFTNAARDVHGLREASLFSAVDLQEEKNTAQVLLCLDAIRRGTGKGGAGRRKKGPKQFGCLTGGDLSMNSAGAQHQERKLDQICRNVTY